MTGRTIVITGASDGIGAAASRLLAGRGDRLLVVGRSREKIDDVARQTGAEPFAADFARLDDVRQLARDIQSAVGDGGIDVLANNAGGIFGDPTPTVDGHEKTFQVDHLAPFLLTGLLLPQLKVYGASVVNTSSVANRRFARIDLDDIDSPRKLSANKAYGDAKLANILFTKSLDARHAADGVRSVAFHPGNIRTNFASDSTSSMRFVYHTWVRRLGLVSPGRGGANLAWFVDGTPGETWEPGAYYDQRTRTERVNPQANDPALAEALWRKSAEAVGLDW